jgi:hypothetical protein
MNRIGNPFSRLLGLRDIAGSEHGRGHLHHRDDLQSVAFAAQRVAGTAARISTGSPDHGFTTIDPDVVASIFVGIARHIQYAPMCFSGVVPPVVKAALSPS